MNGRVEVAADRSPGQPVDDLLDDREALLDLANADPDARIDVALFSHRDLELELAVGRVSGCAASIERAAGGAADIAAGTVLLRQGGLEDSRGNRTILQRCRLVVQLDQLLKALPQEADQSANVANPIGVEL